MMVGPEQSIHATPKNSLSFRLGRNLDSTRTDISFASMHSRWDIRREGFAYQLTHFNHQRLPNQPEIPTRVLDGGSDISGGGYEDQQESNEDQGATEDEA